VNYDDVAGVIDMKDGVSSHLHKANVQGQKELSKNYKQDTASRTMFLHNKFITL
jgi:hypothetical protein